jgi:hypothetical protein
MSQIESDNDDDIERDDEKDNDISSPSTMFSSKSTSLFAHLCTEQMKRLDLEEDLRRYLQDACGWTEAQLASSPAVFFSMAGARNLSTAHVLAKRARAQRRRARRAQVQAEGAEKAEKANKADEADVVKVLHTFPLGAQAEIARVLRKLARLDVKDYKAAYQLVEGANDGADANEGVQVEKVHVKIKQEPGVVVKEEQEDAALMRMLRRWDIKGN